MVRPRSLLAPVTSRTWYRAARGFLTPPSHEGSRLTARRLLNLYLQRYEYGRHSVRLRSYPTRLTIEPTNVCNLACPGCFTGAGEVGRPRGTMPLDLFQKLLDEIGGSLLEIEFYNWGEPLLARNTYSMVEDASRRGIGTVISTNFSVPFDKEKAERLVSSGLALLGVSLDGASQESYAEYRVRGKLDTVLENCRLMYEAKRKLRSATPRMIWEFHVFEHNAHEIDRASEMARELGMDFALSKGWVSGAEPNLPASVLARLPADQSVRLPCLDLWTKVVVNNDGGVAPCCGSFYREDDFGKLAVSADDIGAAQFNDVWNSARYQQARRLFRSRNGSGQDLICHDCPVTVQYEAFKVHVKAGRDPNLFEGGYSFNDGFNYFFDRRKAFGKDAIPLEVVGAPAPSFETAVPTATIPGPVVAGD